METVKFSGWEKWKDFVLTKQVVREEFWSQCAKNRPFWVKTDGFSDEMLDGFQNRQLELDSGV